MKQWEYKTIEVKRPKPLNTKEANELGLKGWELVSIYEYQNNYIAATFKKQI